MRIGQPGVDLTVLWELKRLVTPATALSIPAAPESAMTLAFRVSVHVSQRIRDAAVARSGWLRLRRRGNFSSRCHAIVMHERNAVGIATSELRTDAASAISMNVFRNVDLQKSRALFNQHWCKSFGCGS